MSSTPDPQSPPSTPSAVTADEPPVLPDVTSDERDQGWGDDRDSRRDEDWYRRERPPHHGD